MSDDVRPGDPLPRIELQRAKNAFALTPGRAGLVLFFMRSADCGTCRAHVRRLILLAPDLEVAGFSVVVVVPEEGRDVDLERTLRTPFPIVSGNGAHAMLGLRRAFLNLVQQSGTVVTDAAKVVVKVNRATMPTGSLDEEVLLGLLNTKRAG